MSVGDNFAPLASQIMLDALLAPEFLHMPRKALVGFQPGMSGEFDTGEANRLISSAGFGWKQSAGWRIELDVNWKQLM